MSGTPGFNFSWLLRLCLLLLPLFLGSCAGTAKGVRSTSIAAREAPTGKVLETLPGALVVIRYPAVVLEEAEESYYRAYVDQSIGGDVSITHQHRKDTRHLARSVIAKSSYFAMSLYAELRDLLPANTVLLSPHLIYRGEEGASSRPLLASEEVPSAVILDFNVYTFPDASQLMDSPPITLGDVVTPMLVMHGDSWSRPATFGLRISSEDLLQSSWELSELQSFRQAEAMLSGYSDRFSRPLDLIWFLESREKPAVSIPLKKPGGGNLDLAAVESYPLEKIRMDANLVANLDDSGVEDPFAASFVSKAAQRILAELQGMDLHRSTFLSRYRAYERFDPELALAFLSQAGGEEYEARLRLAQAVIDAEMKFLTTQSERMYRGTYFGEFGKSIRSLIAGEFDVLEERRQLAWMQNLTAALTVVTVAGTIYATSGVASGVSSAIPWAGAAATLGFSSILALNNSREARLKSYAIGESFMSRMAPDLQRYISVQSEVVLSEKDLFARSYGEFESQVVTLYGETARSMPEAGRSKCQFKHPDATGTGVWRGECREGVANGKGYGVIESRAGKLLEYYGDSRNGMAYGTGAMIGRDQSGRMAYLLEGTFRDGVADGSVRVSEPGKAPQIRAFTKGAESGRASNSSWQAVPYP